jgi:hypothetical protein
LRIEVSWRQKNRGQNESLERKLDATCHHLKPIIETQPKTCHKQDSDRNQHCSTNQVEGSDVTLYESN